MNILARDPLETVIRGAGEGWLIDGQSQPAEAMARLHEMLRSAEEWSLRTPRETSQPLTEDRLIAEYQTNPHKVRAASSARGDQLSRRVGDGVADFAGGEY